MSLAMLPDHVHTLVVGAGFGGIGTAATLLRQDPTADVLVLERGDDVGGTWRANTYPGAACDVPSALYSFSFAPEPDWSRAHGTQEEIYAYLRRVARDEGVTRRTMFGCELREAQWDAARAVWSVSTSRGDLTADVLVAATGALSTPTYPKVPGLELFRGKTFHSAEWDHDHDLTGERVAVIGTGASAIQFVPAIVDRVAHLTLFQRTASWVMPKHDPAIARSVRSLYRRFPFTQKLMRGAVYGQKEIYVVGMTKPFARKYLLPLFERRARQVLRKQVQDPTLRERLTPDFAITCKRILLSNEWFPTITRSDVSVVSSGLTAVTENGVVDKDGQSLSFELLYESGSPTADQLVAQLFLDQHLMHPLGQSAPGELLEREVLVRGVVHGGLRAPMVLQPFARRPSGRRPPSDRSRPPRPRSRGRPDAPGSTSASPRRTWRRGRSSRRRRSSRAAGRRWRCRAS